MLVKCLTYNKQTRQFYGDLVMEDEKTRRIYNEAGYLEFGAAGTAPQYYYHVKDYLGSTRALLDRYGNQVQGTDYYTGGLPVAPYGSPMSAEERLHTGKEFNAFSGLAWYDNAARSYDPDNTQVPATGPAGGEVSSFVTIRTLCE